MANEAYKKTTPPAQTNPDAITGEPGSHPIGTGIGAASVAGAATILGAAAAGPIGAAAGAIIGAVAGGLAGKEVAENINPTVVDAYWSNNYSTRPYVAKDSTYDDYKSAYEYGYEQRLLNPNRKFDELESDLSRNWDARKENSRLEWAKAKDAVRDSYELDDGFYNIEANQGIKPRKDS